MLTPQDGAPTLIVGLGSSHGDDQLGWRLAERIAARRPRHVTVRVASEPAEILGWLEGGPLHVCDAYAGTVGQWRRWVWPKLPPRKPVPRLSGHTLSLADSLAVAEQVGLLPETVIIWGVAGAVFAAAGAISPGADSAVEHVISRLLGEIRRA